MVAVGWASPISSQLEVLVLEAGVTLAVLQKSQPVEVCVYLYLIYIHIYIYNWWFSGGGGYSGGGAGSANRGGGGGGSFNAGSEQQTVETYNTQDGIAQISYFQK